MRARDFAPLVAGLMLLGCGPPEGPELVLLDPMELWLGSSPNPPDARDSEWRSVEMPDAWPLKRRLRDLEGWYRTRFVVPEVARGQPLVVYLPSFSGHVTVWWNGQRLGDSGLFRDDETRHVRGPLMLPVPEAWVLPGETQLALRFRATPAVPDFLRAPIVGPRARLLPAYEQKLLFARQLPVLFAAAGVVVAVVVLLAYWRDPEAPTVAWLAAGLIANSLALAGIFTDYHPLSPRIFEPLRASLFHVSVVCFVFALHRIRGLVRPRIERWMIGVSLGFAGLAFALPPIWAYAAAVVWAIPTGIFGLYLVPLLTGVARTLSGMRAAAMLLPLGAVALFVVHDMIGLLRGRFLFDQVLSVYVSGMIALGLMGVLVGRTRQALAESRSLNRELDLRVARKQDELQRNFDRLRKVEREQVVVAERERMLRDMHDGLGGQLVSTLAMVESGRFEADELAEALRDSLDDLRLMVHSLDPAEADLVSMLAVVRERLEPRLARRGLRFAWHVNDVPELPGLDPAGVLHLLRIVQEVITNIVKHADASTITLETATGPEAGATAYVLLSIEDDGIGMPPSPRRGRGLANMRERARLVGAEIEIVSPAGEGGGTRVRLRLPIA